MIITHPDNLRLFADVTDHPVVSPDNWDVYSSLCDYIDQIKTEVEILLKEQEPKTVKEMIVVGGHLMGKCPKCSKILTVQDHPIACGFCGQAAKWE